MMMAMMIDDNNKNNNNDDDDDDWNNTNWKFQVNAQFYQIKSTEIKPVICLLLVWSSVTYITKKLTQF